ncbi:glycosyltransferase [Marinitoga sp. 1155]|uniref:glycosyltransferase n=1 Tax=Marinitoga sp. 1155 TaxID=1428448 RepID=UPI0018CE9BA3|nr:glycosyltransferase [Marinitoga sp. 1155]
MKNIKFIILSAYSPKDIEIASLRIEKLGKYISKKYNTIIISGKPLKQKTKYDIGNSKLIEVDYKIFSKNNNEKKVPTLNKPNKKINKYSIYGHLEYFLPIAPGGKRLYNIRKMKSVLENEIANFEGKIFLIASYGPYFILKLAIKLKQKYKNKIYLIEDFRDMIGKFNPHHSTNIFIENTISKIIKKADIVLTVSKYMGKRFIKYYGLNSKKLYVLYNGIDKNNIFEKSNIDKNNKFKIVYTGSLYENANGSIIPFLEALKKMKKQTLKNLEFIYCGKDFEFINNIFDKYKLNNILTNKGIVNREESIKLQKNADLLLLITYTGNEPDEGIDIISGKFFEYLVSGKPILNIGNKDWELKEDLEIDGVSKVIEAKNIEDIKKYIERMCLERQKLNFKKRKEIIDKYIFEVSIEKFLTKICLAQNQEERNEKF